jgi:hypothetical protein
MFVSCSRRRCVAHRTIRDKAEKAFGPEVFGRLLPSCPGEL